MNRLIAKYFWYFLVGSAVLFQFFIWKNELDLNQPIDSEKFSHYFTCLGVLVGILTVAFVALSYFQNTGINRPHIFPNSFNTIIENVSSIFYHDPSHESERGYDVYKYHQFKTDGVSQSFLEFSLFNSGLSTATNINIQWEFNIEELKKRLTQNHFEEIDIEDEVSEDKYSTDLLFLKNGSETKVRIPTPLLTGFEWNQVPTDYSFYFGGRPKVEYFDVVLIIRYSDILRNPYTTRFSVDFDLLKSRNYIIKMGENERNDVEPFRLTMNFRML
jgi:hypothetical protein